MTHGSDEEAAWRDLVAHYGVPAEGGDARDPWPAREDLPGPDDADFTGPEPPEPPPLGVADPVPGIIPAPPQVRIVRPAVPAPLPDGDEPGADDHFVPPVPPPLPRLDPVTKGAWIALFGGPAYLLLAVMIGWTVSDWAAITAVAAFVGGFTTLVLRMSDRPPRDSGPDDGAVV